MIEEPFARGNSIIHIIDPRIKLIFALLFSIVIALTHKIPVVIIGFAMAILLIFIGQLNIKHLVQRIIAANVFIVLLWLIMPFSIPGKPVFGIFGLTVTQQGILYTLLITIKCNAIILINIALISTSSIFNLVHALRHFRVPDKLIHIFFFLFRYANVMMVEYATLKKTLKVRGFRPTTSMHTYRTNGALIGTLLVRGHDRSEQIHKAMVCRGFKGKYWLLDHFILSNRDMIAACALGLALISMGVIQWTTIMF